MRYLLATLLLTLLPAVAWAQTRYPDVVYPLQGNFVQEEGTIELWVRPEVDPDAPTKNFYAFIPIRVALGEKTYGEQGAFSIMWRPGNGLYTFGGRPNESIKNVPTCWPAKMHWDKGTWHHVALSWKGKEMALYADGELLARSVTSEPMPFGPAGFIVLGFGDSAISVDELAISSVQRSDEQIRQRMQGPLAADEFTLLLDHLDEMQPPAGMARQMGKDVQQVEGRFGQAVQLFRESE